MPWSLAHAGPVPFNALAAVAAADFTQPVYVATADTPNEAWQRTRYAIVFVHVADAHGVIWTVAIMAHIHWFAAPAPGHWVPGSTYIPGWVGWQTATSAANLAIIQNLPDGGVFPPGNDRYPRLGAHAASAESCDSAMTAEEIVRELEADFADSCGKNTD